MKEIVVPIYFASRVEGIWKLKAKPRNVGRVKGFSKIFLSPSKKVSLPDYFIKIMYSKHLHSNQYSRFSLKYADKSLLLSSKRDLSRGFQIGTRNGSSEFHRIFICWGKMLKPEKFIYFQTSKDIKISSLSYPGEPSWSTNWQFLLHKRILKHWRTQIQ